ncbi:uncharacterized protein LOC127844910 isoform X4 [Dreissena polymorpha]|uniref:uncharacterized protein LOC127844910 isoform X4 n=1 Tax=Dreissena polymorpha TaxID=45954 RepID=UPI0022648E69|nr:uncharacterized protein LOC127844910 isoform X4 [Dreissena polymorpha]
MMGLNVLEIAAAAMLLLLTTVRINGQDTDDACSPGKAAGSAITWRRSSDDCSTAVMCLLGRRVTYTCPDGMVIGAGLTDCVPIGSKLDDCSTVDNGKRTSPCKPGTTEPDVSNCAKYSECVQLPSGNATMETRECPYPLLFDKKSGKCEPFKDIVCTIGQTVPKSPCDYEANQCSGASHCVPCSVRHASCSGLPDGLNAWAGREWSPYYVTCDEERVTLQMECKGDKITSVFHPVKRECVEFDNKIIIG